MKARIPVGLALMLVALALSFVPAASIGTQSASALSACNWAQFVADVTVPDGTTFAANTAFTKTWRLKNIGSCTWTTSYALVFDSGNAMGGPTSVNLPSSVAPGQTVDVSVGLTAPGSQGHYIGYWKFMNGSGSRFGIGSTMNTPWWVEIRVGSGSSGVAYDFASNYCSASWFSTAGNLPCPGTDGDPRGFVLKIANPQLENGSTDSGSGLITNPRNIFNGDIHGKFPAFHVQHGDRFQSIINCAYGATGCYVSFRLDYQVDDGPTYTFWAFREKYEGLYYRADVDLNSLAGRDVKFILTVLADGPAGGDRALWSNPAIVRLGPPGPPPSSGSKFDFGTSTSPVASGYTQVTEATAYSSGGFGWTSTTGLESRDRSALADALKRDFVMSSSTAGTFKTDLPDGTYAVTVTMGDNDFAHDNMVVKANGATVLGDVDSAAGAFTVNSFNVTVSAGALQLEFSDAGGSDATWVINAVTIVPTAFTGSKFDFGTSTSPVAAGYTQVTEATAYSSGGFGWTTTTGLESRDRSALADDLKRDFVLHSSAARTFRADVPNGTYAVTVTMGDNDFAHDNMVVKANGATVLGDVDNAAAAFAVNTFNVNVGSGHVDLEFSDAGGSDPTWVVNAVTIVPTSGPPPSFGCDRAQFVADVTVPDGTNFAPGTAFVKTWRLRNVGTCTWTPSYLLVFDTGDQMGGPSSSNLPTTVPPGNTVDVSVNLTAPSAGGTHRGYWMFQNPGGNRFGIGTGANKSWWVEIWVSGPPAPPPPPPPPPASGSKFDFGTSTSPVASGYTKVTEATAYSAGHFGWTDTSALQSRDRGTPASDLNRDFVTNDSGGAGTFKVDLPNGSYSVTVTMGDKDYAHDNMVVKANGVTVLPDVDTALGTFVANSFPVSVTTGSLELEFSDPGGGLDPSWVINAVSIGNQFDFGTSGSPLATGYTLVDESTAFTTALGYGWTDTSTLESRDRLAPDALKQDFVMSSSAARIFKVALLNGSYSVTVTMGDNDYAHDNMVVKANGSTVLGDVDSAAGAFTVNTFPVTVSGGSLQLEFSDAGGSDTTWVVNAVTISP